MAESTLSSSIPAAVCSTEGSKSAPATAATRSARLVPARQAGQLLGVDVSNTVRDPELLNGKVRRPGPFTSVDQACLHEVAKHLANKEGIALGFSLDDASEMELLRSQGASAGLFEVGADRRRIESDEREPIDALVLAEISKRLGQRAITAKFGIPIRDNDEQALEFHRTHDVTRGGSRRSAGG
jgi:hypothetical protein